jgi:hypothetical protein
MQLTFIAESTTARARYKAQFKGIFGKNVEALGINTPVISNIHGLLEETL